MNTNLLTTITYGLRRGFKNFRKNIKRDAIDFKFGNKHTHKNPHALPLELKRKLVNSKKGGQWKKIKELERQSDKPYGKFTKKGFRFDKTKVPLFDIPNIQNFQLKPYVDYNAPLLNQKLLNHQIKINQQKLAKLQSKVNQTV